MHEVWIPENVEAYFAASPIGPLFEVSRVESDPTHPASAALKHAIGRVPTEAIVRARKDDHFLALYGHLERTEQEQFAREWVIIDELHKRIRSRRRALLLCQDTTTRPPPYDESALADLPISSDRLVPLSEFDIEEGVLLRQGRAFIVLPLTPSENSSYWITRALATDGCRDRVSVRLDPLIRGDAHEFPRTSYRMLWWGPPLRWKDVVTIEEEKFGRWVPGALSGGGEFTDFAWVPRGVEQHLFLEEVPKRAHVEVAGSRYFHVIFSRATASVVHLDGATRIYSESEWDNRRGVHVHRTGKVGTRVKVLRIDYPMEPDAVSALGATFFVWNNDVWHFFGAPIPSSLLGTVV